MKYILLFVLATASLSTLAQKKNKPKTWQSLPIDTIPPRLPDRYFFVGVAGTNQEGYPYAGGIDIISPVLPTLDQLRDIAAEKMKLKKAFITSVYEHKNFAEYKRFWEGSTR